jgi:transposase-like protein
MLWFESLTEKVGQYCAVMSHRLVKRPADNITFAEIEKIASDEDACLALFERLRFPDGLRCAACGASDVSGQRFTRHRTRVGLFTCGACRRQFTLTSGTAMHRTRLPLSQWLRAIWLIVASSKGVSARKLSEMLGITYKVAWHLGHRIRAMMTDESVVLSGIVEMDEIYAGAPPRTPHGGGPSGAKSGRGPRRPLVLTMVERGGPVAFQRIASHSIAAIRPASHNRISGDAIVSTDALPAYRKAVSGRRHVTVKHSAGEFVQRNAGGIGVDAHTNTAEAVHAEIRRAVIGVWHWISPKHLDRYLDEIAWRHNRRESGHLRRIAAVLAATGQPLPVRALVNGMLA